MERPEQTQSAQPSEQERAGWRRRPLAIALRVALIAVVVLAMVLLAHVLRHPAGFGGENVEGSGQAAPDRGWPPEVELSGAPPPPDEKPTTAQEAEDGLRHVMAGLIMAALGEGDEVSLGESTFKVIHLPGHTPGGLGLYWAGTDSVAGMLFSGDALFAGGIGRTDFPGGDEKTLLSVIREKLFALPDDTLVLPGHGPSTTIGREKETNPFFGAG